MTPESLIKTTDQLNSLSQTIQATMQSSSATERPPPRVFAVYLASFFQYNIDQGGFAQLLYNAHGDNLPEIEDMLMAANASTALQCYREAISLCTSDIDAYQTFIGSDYISPSDLKNALHGVSIEYFRLGSSFLAEAAGFIDESGEIVAAWVRQQEEI